MAYMTLQDRQMKRKIYSLLMQQGYVTYADIFKLFDLHLTADPNIAAFMVPEKGQIVLNRTIPLEQVSTIIRHEILHEYLQHLMRMVKKAKLEKVATEDGEIVDIDTDDLSLDDLNNLDLDNQVINIAGDYEISNLGYTEEDKEVARHLMLNGKEVKGLVTEDEHPDWVDLSLEDMYDKLMQERQKDQEQQANNQQQGDQKQDDQKKDSQDNQQSSSGQQDSNNQGQNQNNNTQGSQSGSGSNENSTLKGRLIDDNTFELDSGEIIRL